VQPFGDLALVAGVLAGQAEHAGGAGGEEI
jgi:hypothetical protein